MSQLDKLIRNARASMKTRGHEPNPAERWHEWSSGRSGAHIMCEHCGLYAHVICKPAPNEVNVGGEAIALNCNVATKHSATAFNEVQERRHQAMTVCKMVHTK